MKWLMRNASDTDQQ